MSRLYVSDLDGTLLRDDATLSDFSRAHLVELLSDGLAFTVASARSVVAMRMILGDLPLRLPVIELNGALISDLCTGRHRIVHAIDAAMLPGLHALVRDAGCAPFLSTLNGEEDRLYYRDLPNDGMRWYCRDRAAAGDPRLRRADDLEDCRADPVVCITVIDRRDVLEALSARIAERFPGRVAANLFENRYSPGWYWLTVHDRRATKDQGVEVLRREFGFEAGDVVAFGDNLNDIALFRVAGTAVAVGNAADELKAHATHVIGTNEEDSVVRYLLADRR